MNDQTDIVTTYTHVVVRGNNQQIIFENDFDRLHFLELLGKYQDEYKICIIAYCLMDNHVHLLIEDNEGTLPCFMQHLLNAYVKYFNLKYDRVGHLFQGRYRRRKVRSDVQLLETFLYILRNPQKACICLAQNYPWSSIHEYVKDGLTNASIIRHMAGENVSLEELLGRPDVNHFFLEDRLIRDDDERVSTFIKDTFHMKSSLDVNALSCSRRDEILVLLHKMGVSVKQISRLTGVNRGAAERAVKRMESVAVTDSTPWSL